MCSSLLAVWAPLYWLYGLLSAASMGSSLLTLWAPLYWLYGLLSTGSMCLSLLAVWAPLYWLYGLLSIHSPPYTLTYTLYCNTIHLTPYTLHHTMPLYSFIIQNCNTGLTRDGKTYKRASNACVNFFLGRVKYVPNFTLFCRKSELCRNFALLGVILMAFNLVRFYFYFKKRNK